MKFPRLSMSMNHARILAGAGSFLLTIMVFMMMLAKPELADNDLFKSLAQAIVIQGLIGLVMAFLFTGKQGAEEAPQQVHVVNRDDEPVPVETKGASDA